MIVRCPITIWESARKAYFLEIKHKVIDWHGCCPKLALYDCDNLAGLGRI